MPALVNPTRNDPRSGAAEGDAGWRRWRCRIFVVLFALGLGWSLYTQHVWEDFYITYRASKNLATGHGLTFTAGERVHSFTSPLGVLLPALASILTGNRSDTAALWIFRVLSIGAYAGAGVFLWRCCAQLFACRWPAVFVLLMYAVDAKIVDFTTNGMETPYVLLFLIWTLYALFFPSRRQAVHLGLSWAGLMWCRPDSFVYIGALGIGALLFMRFTPRWVGRWRLLKTFFGAGAIATVLYGPWLVWAWSYYGSPIPHTVIAKGLLAPPVDAASLAHGLADFPARIIKTGASLGATFMPPYAEQVNWPVWAVRASFWLSLIALVLWLFPLIRREARIASFGFFVGQFYLNDIARSHSPWYVPTVTVLAIIAIAGLIDALENGFKHGEATAPAHSNFQTSRSWVVRITALLPVGALALLCCTAWQMRWSQQIDEAGNRRKIGEWLAAEARPADTVFLECLGYIGFYSNLKMYDFPGLSSPEVVAARRRLPVRGDYKEYFADLIVALHPDWVVLRRAEVYQVDQSMPKLLTADYRLVKVFDVQDKVAAIPFLPGRDYLAFDAHFEVFRRLDKSSADRATANPAIPITVQSLITNRTYAGPAKEVDGNLGVHVPSLLAAKVPANAQWIGGRFGFARDAYRDADHRTSGAIFRVTMVDSAGARTVVFQRTLMPFENYLDRPEQRFAVDLPRGENLTVEFTTETIPGKANAFGWTYWSGLQFEFSRTEPGL